MCCHFLIIFVLILFVKNIVCSCHFIQERKAGMASIKVSRLHLVDLAGSERQKDTHAEGLRLKVSNAYELIFMIFIACLKINAYLWWLHQGMFCPARGEGRRLFSKGKFMPSLDTPRTQPPFFDVLVAVASCGLLAYLPGRSRGCMNKYHRRAVRMEH